MVKTFSKTVCVKVKLGILLEAANLNSMNPEKAFSECLDGLSQIDTCTKEGTYLVVQIVNNLAKKRQDT